MTLGLIELFQDGIAGPSKAAQASLYFWRILDAMA